jgi:hypothetical protein
MAKKRAKLAPPKAVLPNRGDAFVVPLPDGRYGACRVIRRGATDAAKRKDDDRILVAASSWIGQDVPDMKEPRLREILVLTHHSWENSPVVHWVDDRVPDSFKGLGTIEPSRDEEELECSSCSGWESFPLQVYLQWRWDNEREAVLREDEQQRESEKREREESAKRHSEYLAGLTLEALKKKRRFTRWTGYVPDKVIAACRRVFRETVDSLIELGTDPKKRTILPILQQCIERLNKLNSQHGGFISTIEREKLCEEFSEIAYVSGMPEYDDLADRWREW